MKYQIFLISIFVFISSCSNTKQYVAADDWIHQKAKENFEKYSIEYNEDETLALILSTNKDDVNPNFKLKFIVLELSTKKIIMQRVMDNTVVSWYTTTKILAVTQLGFEDKKTGLSQKRQIFDVLIE